MKDMQTKLNYEQGFSDIDGDENQDMSFCFHRVLKTALEAAQRYSDTSLANLSPVLIDADIVLDVLLRRKSKFFKDMKKVLNLVFSRKVDAYISEAGLQRVWNISRMLKGDKDANYMLFKLLRYFGVCSIDREAFQKGCMYSASRVSVGLQIEHAKKIDADLIVSSVDVNEFAKCGYGKIYSPSTFIHKWLYENKAYNGRPKEVEDPEKIVIANRWKIEDFNLSSSKSGAVVAHVALSSKENIDERFFGTASSSSSVEAILNAFDDAIIDALGNLPYERLSIKFVDVEEDAGSSVIASSLVKAGSVVSRKYFSSCDSVQACLYAYAKAVSEIIEFSDKDAVPALEESVEIHSARFQITQDVREQYIEHKVREFSHRSLRDSNFDDFDFSDNVSFRQCDFSLSSMCSVNLTGANLEGSTFKKTRLLNAKMEDTNLSKAKLSHSDLSQASLIKSDLSGTELNECILRGTFLQKANLSGASLTYSVLSEANLSNANLSQSSLRFADLSNANLTGANLTGADLTYAKLDEANLTNANLAGAILRNVDFCSVVIDGANISGTDLTSANLSKVDITKAVFCKPHLTDTEMPEVKFEVYGSDRSEKVVSLLSQIESDHYQIYAVHSDVSGTWWNSSIGRRLLEINRDLVSTGVEIRRIFVIPEGRSSGETKEVLKAHKDAGVMVRTILGKTCSSIGIHPCSDQNFLILKNRTVARNSFVTMMLSDNTGDELSGYISYRSNDIETYEDIFCSLWSSAESTVSEQTVELASYSM